MEKLLQKLNITISEKDKKLIYVLACVAVLAITYFFIYNPIITKADEINEEVEELDDRYNRLKSMNNNKETYEAGTDLANAMIEASLKAFDNGITQSDSIIFVNKIEGNTGVWIKSVTLGEITQKYTFGNITSTNPENSGKKVYSTDMKGFSTTYTISYEATYDQLKDLIDYFNNRYSSKCTIDSITMTYNNSDEIVTGSLTITLYVITGSERIYSPSLLKHVQIGTGNIFRSSTFDQSNLEISDEQGNYIINDYDFNIILSTASENTDSVVIQKRNDPTGETLLSNNNTGMQDVTMRFFGTAGAYKVQYKIGSVTYPATDYINGGDFDPGESLDLLVKSSIRKDDTDTSGINATIINESDARLNIKVIGEDLDNPRFVLGTYEGRVTKY